MQSESKICPNSLHHNVVCSGSCVAATDFNSINCYIPKIFIVKYKVPITPDICMVAFAVMKNSAMWVSSWHDFQNMLILYSIRGSSILCYTSNLFAIAVPSPICV